MQDHFEEERKNTNVEEETSSASAYRKEDSVPMEETLEAEPVWAEAENIEAEVMEAEPEAEEVRSTVKIDLSGGAIPRNETNGGGNAYYTENIYKTAKKEKSRGKRYLAAVLAMTVLNLGLFAGTFFLGSRYGAQNHQVASKQQLMDQLRGEGEAAVSETINRGPAMDTTEIAKKVGPAVVGITSVAERQISFFGGISQSNAEGSGIILSADGYIVTNNHVVEGATAVQVTLNTGSEYEAKVVGMDAETDLAVIKIEPKETLTVATLGDSSKLEVGERVIAIGNPMGLEFFGSVTQGIVSAINRSINVDNRTMNLIQTDAAINSGNSGGALINAYGEVVGINSVKVTSSGVEGMSFAIPISEANPIISDLLEFGYVKGRPVIGISTRDVNEYMAQSYSWPMGAQVMSVGSETARTAGLEQGDIITAVNGEKISTGEELNKIKDQFKPGETLELEVYKYATGRTEKTDVVLSEQLPD